MTEVYTPDPHDDWSARRAPAVADMAAAMTDDELELTQRLLHRTIEDYTHHACEASIGHEGIARSLSGAFWVMRGAYEDLDVEVRRRRAAWVDAAVDETWPADFDDALSHLLASEPNDA